MPMPGATANGSFAYKPISRVIVKQMMTVAVSTPLKDMPVLPSAEMIWGLTTTMYAIVKKVVIPAMASVLRLGLRSGESIRDFANCASLSIDSDARGDQVFCASGLEFEDWFVVGLRSYRI